MNICYPRWGGVSHPGTYRNAINSASVLCSYPVFSCRTQQKNLYKLLLFLFLSLFLKA